MVFAGGPPPSKRLKLDGGGTPRHHHSHQNEGNAQEPSIIRNIFWMLRAAVRRQTVRSALRATTPSNQNFLCQASSNERRNLPIFQYKHQLLEELKKRETCIIIGETGSGKSTQVPQYLFDSGLDKNLVIAVTQPRRVAAISLAHRVADERNLQVGNQVGYNVRFDHNWNSSTSILFMTDGLMLREAVFDKLLKRYSVIIIDEAHERSVRTDVLFGIVKNAQKFRSTTETPLKVIIMSATMDADKFSQYFDRADVLYLEGRQHRVQLMYSPTSITDYVYATLVTIFQIHRDFPADEGILAFLPGSDEIDSLTRRCREISKEQNERKGFPQSGQHAKAHFPKMEVTPLYSAVTSKSTKLFQRPQQNARKVVIATNIAETSLTIPGIRHVIDCGKVKARQFTPKANLDMLRVVSISKAQACQRAGRAGRETQGTCYRLYTETEYNKFAESMEPDIQRCNLSSVLLELLSMQILQPTKFDFIDKPGIESLSSGVTELTHLGAVSGSLEDQLGLTDLGRQMSLFPLEPKFSRLLLAAEALGCLDDAISLVALLSVEHSIFQEIRIERLKAQCLEAHRKFAHKSGDHLTLLNVFRSYQEQTSTLKIEWCRANFLNHRQLQSVDKIRSDLLEICRKQGLSLKSCGNNTDLLRRALCHGLFLQVGEIIPNEKRYKTVENRLNVSIHPSSVLFSFKAPMVVYTDLLYTSQVYMKTVSMVEPQWVFDAAPSYCREKHFFQKYESLLKKTSF